MAESKYSVSGMNTELVSHRIGGEARRQEIRLGK